MYFKKRPSAPQRRTRTPQPTVRPGAVFSYHANRSVRESSIARDATSQQSEAIRRRSRVPWARQLPITGALLLIAVVTVFCLQLSNQPKLVTLGTDKNQLFLREQSIYITAAQKAFTSLLNRNKLTVNTQKIAADMQKQFPELKVVTVTLPVVGTRPVVYIQPMVPEVILVSQQGGIFLLDSNGRAMIAGNQVAKLDEIDVPVVTDQSNLPIRLGELTLPRSTVAFIAEVFGQLRAKGLHITGLILPSGTSELHVRLQGVGYYTKYNLYGNAREETGSFLAVKAQLDREHKVPQEYVDVRVEGKAYYK